MKYSHSLAASNIFEGKEIVKKLIEGGLEWLHLDFVDYKFARSFGLNKTIVRNIKKSFPNLTLEAHLMVKEPSDLIEDLIKEGVGYINFPPKEVSLLEFKELIKKNKNTKFGIAILSNEKISDLREYILLCDYVVIMTIDKIGGTGQALNHGLLSKANEVKNIKDIIVISDGGLRDHNAIDFKRANFDVAVGGSIINNVDDKKDFIKYFDKLVKNV